MLDLDADHIRISGELHDGRRITYIADHEAIGKPGAGRLGVGIQYMDGNVVTKGVLDEHPTQLAPTEQGDRAQGYHRGKDSRGIASGLSAVSCEVPTALELGEPVTHGEFERAVRGEQGLIVPQSGGHRPIGA